jgi:hypothetical protein
MEYRSRPNAYWRTAPIRQDPLLLRALSRHALSVPREKPLHAAAVSDAKIQSAGSTESGLVHDKTAPFFEIAISKFNTQIRMRSSPGRL